MESYSSSVLTDWYQEAEAT